jgi:hypothetical protein
VCYPTRRYFGLLFKELGYFNSGTNRYVDGLTVPGIIRQSVGMCPTREPKPKMPLGKGLILLGVEVQVLLDIRVVPKIPDC